ncbi:MAG: hypothetical protein WD738_23400 [Pirellulales bacterium]
MGTILIDKLLSACVERRASDLYLTAGAPPMLRVQGQLQRFGRKVLKPADTHLLMECVTPYRSRQEFLETGNADFEFGFGEVCRFHVSVIRGRENVAMAVRRIPKKNGNMDQQR